MQLTELAQSNIQGRATTQNHYRYECEQKHWSKPHMDEVLVIEDEPSIAMLLANIIEDYGYEVTIAFDGKQGFELARTGKYKLIITDNMLPYVSGREICVRLKNEPAASGSTIVIMSAVTNLSDFRNIAAAFLSKPFDISTIDQLIQRFLVEPEAKRRVDWDDGAAHPIEEFPSGSKNFKANAKSSFSGNNDSTKND